MVDRFRSVSHVAVLPAADQAAVLDEVRALLATHPDTAGRDEIAIPYRVDAYWCERSPWPAHDGTLAPSAAALGAGQVAGWASRRHRTRRRAPR